jgi:4-aminobutyrate aminotransferase-like enzyme/Ser/Thr protein kinase RdoA (MazF antagonist)
MTATFDETFEGLPRPEVSLDQAAEIARTVFGCVGAVTELGSQQDRNFLIEGHDGRRLLKVSNPVFPREELEAQNETMSRVASTGIACPTPLPSRDGDTIATVQLDGRPHSVRLLTFVEGTPLIDFAHLGRDALRQLGTLAGSVSRALADFRHPGLVRQLQWDLRHGEALSRALLPVVGDAGRRDRLERALDDVSRRLGDVAPRLPIQALHGDLTDDNTVAEQDALGRPVLAGVIDFGDAALGWRVAELAVACSACFHHGNVDPLVVLDVIDAFDALVPLSDSEIDALWPLLVVRGATLVVSGQQQVAIDPSNDYAASALEREWQMFAVPAALDIDVATAAIRQRLGRSETTSPLPPLGSLLPSGWPGTVALIDLSAESRDLRDGCWIERAQQEERRLLADAAAGSGLGATRFGEARLTRASPADPHEPHNVALGVELRAGAGQLELVAPFDGTLRSVGESIALVGDGVTVVLAGLHDAGSGTIAAGEHMGAVGRSATIWLARSSPERPVLELPPRFVPASQFPAWRARYADPGLLLGVATAAGDGDPGAALERRSKSYAPLQAHYYERPPLMVRGWREYLIDSRGRSYLDMVNNVTVLGHGHPRVAEAAADQWRMLNTNSRFHFDAVTELSERLLATLPGSFDTVLLVNSGTEAVDLALRLTKAFTGRADVMCVTESYHGWSLATDAVSTSVSDNPLAAGTRPDWVHVTPTPNAYRGQHRGPDAGRRYAADTIGQLRSLAADGRPVGTFLAEPRAGNAGAIEVPPGYFAAVYDEIHAGGGLAIADEVQVGYGRQGDVFWGFQQHPGVLPDVLTVAKAMGNGHPLGAVIARREIVEALASQGTFFSSAGGSTLSSRIGTTVLDVIEEEGMQANALQVGTHLRARLGELALRHPLIGAVHGSGLYLGVELVRDRESLEPAHSETRAVCDRMLELGVVVQPTGDRQNILKVKPPMCITLESADFFVDMLDETLTSGY